MHPETVPAETLADENRLPGIAILLPPASAFGLAVAKAADLDTWAQSLTSAQVASYWTANVIFIAWGLLTLVCAFVVARGDMGPQRGFLRVFAYISRFLGATLLHVLVSVVILAASIPVLLLVAIAASMFK